MCGIAGLIAHQASYNLDDSIRKMTAQLTHRGPDDSGTWIDADMRVALGHQRLAILDLSAHGRQPMTSPMERYVIVFNGEIYNFHHMREELMQLGYQGQWRGNSDTEVLLAAFETWGIEKTLQKAVGMFAIALWDRTARTLMLARDRLGEKPLYYGILDHVFAFASELKAIRAASPISLDINRDALVDLLSLSYIPAPTSIYQQIYKLPPGHYLTIDLNHFTPTLKAYWTLESKQHEPYIALQNMHDAELLETVHQTLKTSVELQMIADVPLGAFLSGGIDSSLVVALMQAQSSQPVRSYTIGFHEAAYNEAPYAKAVAQHLGTHHTEMYVSAQDAANIIPLLAKIYDEPFADSSQIPTALVAKLTSQHVKVSLSGDGGDELFAGYGRYPQTAALWHTVQKYPAPLRHYLSSVIHKVPQNRWNQFIKLLPSRYQRNINGHRMHRMAKLLSSKSLAEMYRRLVSNSNHNDVLLGNTYDYFSPVWTKTDDPIQAMRFWDCKYYLPDDLLVKVDRASMFSSLEARAPFLDHRVVELAFALPRQVLIRNGMGKWILRRILDQYIPQHLIERPKSGFSIPLATWLRGPLKGWAEALLEPSYLAEQGYLNVENISKIWQQHQMHVLDGSTLLWNVLMFQAWLQEVA